MDGRSRARLLILWDAPQHPAEFHRHYRELHIPLVRRLPGLRRYTLSRGVDARRDSQPYHLVAELDFDDMASLERALQSPEGRATAADATDLAAVGGTRLRSMVYELEDVG